MQISYGFSSPGATQSTEIFDISFSALTHDNVSHSLSENLQQQISAPGQKAPIELSSGGEATRATSASGTGSITLIPIASSRGIQETEGNKSPTGSGSSEGEQGKQGPEGEQGKQSPGGEQGKQGLESDQGKTGVQGSRGLQGDKGPTGDRGPVGTASLLTKISYFYFPVSTLAAIAVWDRFKHYWGWDRHSLRTPCDALEATKLFDSCLAMTSLVGPIPAAMISFMTNLTINHMDSFIYQQFELQVSTEKSDKPVYRTISVDEITSIPEGKNTEYRLIFKDSSNFYNELPDTQASYIYRMFHH